MAYYYDQDGNKIPVDDHSPPEAKAAAAAQEQANAQASNGDTTVGGDAGGVQAPQAGPPPLTPDGALVETLTPGPAQQTGQEKKNVAAEQAAAADAAAKKAAYDQAQGHFEYGGWAGGAAEAASRYAKLGSDAQGRQGETIDQTNTNADRANNLGARGDSMSMADLLAGRANGSVPLISGMRANQDTNRALADQTSIAASARGPAALALAQQQQANNSAAAVSNISNSAQINGAQEQLNNTMAAGQAFNTIRGGDSTLQNMDAATATAQANINANQRAENDKYQLGMTGYETGVQKAQLDAQGNQVGIATGAANAAAARDQAAGFHADDRTDKYLAPVIGAGATVVGTGLVAGASSILGSPAPTTGSGTPGVDPGAGTGSSTGSTSTDGAYNAGSAISDPNSGSDSSSNGDPYPPGRADGGPVQGGHPYLVGERGPELIVPPRDGHVLTAEQTRAVAPPSRVDAFLDGIHPLSYHYKQAASEPRSQPTGGRYLGISAQDLEAVPEVGHQMVSEGPRGKQIEMGPTLSAALAGMARLHERVKAMEGGGSEHITSDMAAKTNVAQEGKAAAWDQGHAATLANVDRVAQMSPEELRASQRPEAQAVRGIKADAWDEGHRNALIAASDAHAAEAVRNMDAERAATAARRTPREPFDDSFSRFNPIEALRGRHPLAAPVQQPGPAVAHVPAPTGDFDEQVRDQFGGPRQPTIAALDRGGR